MLKGLGNLEDAILSSLFGVISSKREDMENKWKKHTKIEKNLACLVLFLCAQFILGVKKSLSSLTLHKY